RNRRALAATARDRAVPGAARYGAWQRVGGLPLGCGADVVVAACEAETPGSDRPSNRYSSGVLVPRLLAHLPHFLVVVSTVVVLSVRVSKQIAANRDLIAPVVILFLAMGFKSDRQQIIHHPILFRFLDCLFVTGLRLLMGGGTPCSCASS